MILPPRRADALSQKKSLPIRRCRVDEEASWSKAKDWSPVSLPRLNRQREGGVSAWPNKMLGRSIQHLQYVDPNWLETVTCAATFNDGLSAGFRRCRKCVAINRGI